MFGFGLAFIGVFYIVAQWLLAMSFEGNWRVAAFLPVPILIVTIICTVAFGAFLPLDSATLLLLGLPLALIYLTLLSAIHFAARMLHAERAYDPGGRFRK